MRTPKALCRGLFLLVSGVMLASGAQAAEPAKRIVVLGGDITEIVYALGEGDKVVGVDTTSLYPVEAQERPQLGYIRALNAEGILALKPDLVLASAAAGPPPVMMQLTKAGMPVVSIPQLYTLEGIESKINSVAGALGLTEKAADLIHEVAAQSAQVEGKGAGPRVLFVLQVQGHGVMAAGEGTAADHVISLAGAQNVLGDMPGYKSVGAESLATRQIDVILFMAHSAEAYGGVKALEAHPALRMTAAVKAGRVWGVDEMALLGFGPRTPTAIRDLARKLTDDE